MNWFKIRRARPEDIDGMYRVERACFPLPWSRDDLKKDATENILAVYLVAEAASGSAGNGGNEIAGYAGVWVVLDEGHITNVAVHPDRRRQGVAAMLLLQLLEAAREKGAERFTLEVKRTNEAAISLYERYGFRITDYRKGYYREDGEDAAIMWREPRENEKREAKKNEI
ncbi:MAG: ribosomal protein S18-alanine N-acetyltransferase [Clostridiales Family XIII bacterium]|jgi:ribosomal-protein-alanine N-acetyltransferase|nr:ribosomal protein S18-alanine N-acetyltransferase [Clostridiales Family XIII bacterium]